MWLRPINFVIEGSSGSVRSVQAEAVPNPSELGAGAYLDHAATTVLYPQAREVLLDWLSEPRGNPSGAHRLARAARRALDDARDDLAAALGCGPGDVVFTSGGTEADNLALFGVMEAPPARSAPGVDPTQPCLRGAVACSAVEHHAVLEPVHALGGTVLAVDSCGRVDLDRLAGQLAPDTRLVSIMAVNNEVGTINDLAAVVAMVRERTGGRALVHTDAVAAFPWIDVVEAAASVDLLSISAHKFGGPPGVGALVVRPGVALRARLLGGGQERDRRSGTPNVAGIMAMAAAARQTVAQRPATVARVAAQRDRFVDTLGQRLDGVGETVPDRAAKVAGNAHLCFQGVASEELLFLLDRGGVGASAASSCASGAIQISHVLAAMGIHRVGGGGAVRFTLGWTTTDAEIDRGLDVVIDAVQQLRRARR